MEWDEEVGHKSESERGIGERERLDSGGSDVDIGIKMN